MRSPAIFHFRQAHTPKGGITVVYNFETQAFGFAVCSNKDMYSKGTGVRIAIGRSRSKEWSVAYVNNTNQDLKQEAIRIAKDQQDYVNESTSLRASMAKFKIDRNTHEDILKVELE